MVRMADSWRMLNTWGAQWSVVHKERKLHYDEQQLPIVYCTQQYTKFYRISQLPPVSDVNIEKFSVSVRIDIFNIYL